MSSSVLGSKQEMTTLKKLSHSLKRHQHSLFSHLFPLFSGVAGPRPGSTAPVSYEGSQFPDACDLHTSLRLQLAPSATTEKPNCLFVLWQPLFPLGAPARKGALEARHTQPQQPPWSCSSWAHLQPCGILFPRASNYKSEGNFLAHQERRTVMLQVFIKKGRSF